MGTHNGSVDFVGDNPLLQLGQAGVHLPFATVLPEHVQPAMHALMAEAKRVLTTIAGSDEPPTWGSVYEALEQSTESLSLAFAIVTHLEAVRTTPELRREFNAVKPEVSAFFASISLDEALFARLKQYAATDEAQRLPKEEARALATTLDEFRRQGAHLDAERKQQLEAMTRELAICTSKFAQNVLDDTSVWTKLVDDEADLAGLPDTAMRLAKAEAQRRNQTGWLLTLHAPSFIPALTYLDSAPLREEIYRAYYARASAGDRDNSRLIIDILGLRRRQAKLLGYNSFADYVLEPRMAKTAENARKFVRELTERTQVAFTRETEALFAFRQELEGDEAPPLQPWDVAYYAEKMRKARYDFDEEALRPYFEVRRVVDGLFSIAQKLFGIDIVETSELPIWHADVRAFAVREVNKTLGYFYVDLHPRDDKRAGAWMHGLSSGIVREGYLDRPHIGLFAANVSRPVDGQPALLSHREVETLFHEFGHLLHHLLSRVAVRGQAGTRVAWDFVELPSQLLENWCWSKDALDLFARHHETNEPIPKDLFDKMHKARTFRSASAMMRQLGFAEVDLALHMDFEPSTGEEAVNALARYTCAILEQFSPTPLYEGWAFINGFTHLFAAAVAYASGYYSYKWAEVLDADVFTQFAPQILSSKVGGAFRTEILEKGDSAPPDVLFRSFMGRDPDMDALLVRSGLLTAEES
ncbi:MAG: M3 family metallopeptidase [Myxococcales bacterium]|nr:M3 family metallopeptidase [Myxococcales bacterium]